MSREINILLSDNELGRPERGAALFDRIDPEELAKNLSELKDSLQVAIEKLANTSDKIEVEKVVFNVGLSAKGSVSLLGTGVSGSANASLALHLKPKMSK